MYCLSCGRSETFRSHFRVSDIPHLFLFQYPVRCRVCRRRYYTSLFGPIKGTVCCAYCYENKLHRSHLRIVDLPFLLLMQYPVRCHVCRRRQSIALAPAMRLAATEQGPRPRVHAYDPCMEHEGPAEARSMMS